MKTGIDKVKRTRLAEIIKQEESKYKEGDVPEAGLELFSIRHPTVPLENQQKVATQHDGLANAMIRRLSKLVPELVRKELESVLPELQSLSQAI